MRRFLPLLCAALLCPAAFAQPVIDPADYDISRSDIRRARKVLSTPLKEEVTFPNPSPGAAWFPEASLGLFLHWGIHSVGAVQPSWNMIRNYRWSGPYHTPEEYYGWAAQFNPGDFDPDRFLKAAKDAGFTYAVLTTRHHDGYALWPSKYGIGVKQYLDGRDLVGEFVEACRRNGLKVGLYYSPRDWHYPGVMLPEDFDSLTSGKNPPITDSLANYREFEKFTAYVLAQIEELLTRYGKIDLLWLDGMGWRGIDDLHTEQIYAWIRSLQEEIVVNDRWSNVVNPDLPEGTAIRIGDFTTPFECTRPGYRPSEWWEHCHIWTCGGGGWGYDKTGTFRPVDWFLDALAVSRSMGGNFLVNASPDAEGRMHPNYYVQMDSLSSWMAWGKESVIGAGPGPGPEKSNVVLTSRGGDVLYAHIPPSFKGTVSVMCGRKPAKVTLLRTGEEIPYVWLSGYAHFKLDPSSRTKTDDVVKIVLE